MKQMMFSLTSTPPTSTPIIASIHQTLTQKIRATLGGTEGSGSNFQKNTRKLSFFPLNHRTNHHLYIKHL
jgi:hypothetical protein